MSLTPEPTLTYRRLLAVPGFARFLLATLLVRTGGSVWQLGLVLFVLQKFHSPGLAGLAIFLSIGPGILISPLAGVLLDRHGRVRLMLLDYTIAGLSVVLIVWLSVSGRLTVGLLLPIVAISSVTNPLGSVGSRSMFPLIVPRPLWDRANALDSIGYTLPAIVGPALAGGLTAAKGAELALLASAIMFVASAVVLVGLTEPESRADVSEPVLPAALGALRYVMRNRSLRGIAVGISVLNLGQAVLVVGLPVLVFDRLHGGPALVGQLWAAQGAAGVIGSLLAGRMNTEGKERQILAGTMIGAGAGIALLAIAGSWWLVLAAMLIQGAFIGPGDVAMFSMRQRRTHEAWFGRAFAVSMNLNYAGLPVGSAISGQLVQRSLSFAFIVGAGLSLVAAWLTLALVPAEHEEA